MSGGRGSSLLAAAALGLLPGCLSLSRGEPPAVRYFEPALPAPEEPGAAPPAPFRLGRVSAAEHLRDRLVWRVGETEVGFHEDRRWTELPVRYLERVIGDELHRRRALPPEAPAAVLDVRLEAFSEVVRPRHEAVVVVRFGVERRDGRRREVVVEARRPLSSDDPVEMAEAVGEALVEVVKEGTARSASTE